MARRILNDQDQVVAMEFSRAELAQLWKVSEMDLDSWAELVPPTSTGPDGAPVYHFTREQYQGEVSKLLMILRTRMSVPQVQKIIKEGMLDAYAALAEDCPYERGITAHVWRSYAIIVHIQEEEGRAIDEHELAWRGRLMRRNPATGAVEPSPSLAAKHISLLHNARMLDVEGSKWVHRGMPKSLKRRKR